MCRLFSILAIIITGFSFIILQACKKHEDTPVIGTSIAFTIPAGWPTPVYNFDSNRLTVEPYEILNGPSLMATIEGLTRSIY